MKTNMGNADRIVRMLLAVTAIILFFVGTIPGTPGTVLMVLSGVFLLTSIIGFCPVYALIGVSTKRKSHR